MLTIDKSAYENGLLQGKLTGKYLRRKLDTIRKIAQKTDYSGNVFTSRSRDFTNLLKKVAPAWLEEAKGIADGAGMNADELLMLNSPPSDTFSKGGMNCTSFMRIGDRENLLFKIRDERNWTQHFVIKKNGNAMRFQAGTDIGNLGVAYFFNENCIAGANNTGSESKDISDEPRLSDCHILRLFAEQCKSVDDAPVLLEKLLKAKAVGGAGRDRGIIFLLVDKEKGMLLECTSEDYALRVIDNGILSVSNHYLTRKAQSWKLKKPRRNTVLRKKRIDELLDTCADNPTLKDIMRFSRDRKHLPHALCNDDGKHFWMTLSAAAQVINRQEPGNSRQLFCCGNTRNSFYLPFSVRENNNFLPLVSGDFYETADKLYKKFACGDHLLREQRKFEREIIKSMAQNRFPEKLEQTAFNILKFTFAKQNPVN
ncbi:MAG: C45 family autoproteolytic acyltransferase/hydrolase [Victivallaceae bacterium]